MVPQMVKVVSNGGNGGDGGDDGAGGYTVAILGAAWCRGKC